MKRNRRIRKIYEIIFVILVIIAIILFYFAFNKKTLKKIGYNKEEISVINKLSKDEINTIKKYDYNKNLIAVINNEEYDKSKLDSYLKYLDKYDKPDAIIRYVNNYKDKVELDDFTINLLNEKYFIDEYFDRYIAYYKDHTDLDTKEIVTRINSNLDHTFYVDSKPADISKGMYTLVNKYNHLDANYVPSDLVQVDRRFTHNTTKVVKVANDNYVKLAEAGLDAGVHFLATTCYRDYNFQSILYYNYVSQDGVEAADTYSARPGSSEHQLGYSLDLTNTSYVDFDNFVYTEEYKWLKDNAHKYGFILRYPEGKEYITGYIFEPWHIRYVGVDIATYIYENNITYEEYYAYFLR